MKVYKSYSYSRRETLTIVIPELFQPQTMSTTHMSVSKTAVLLRRVLVRRINMG